MQAKRASSSAKADHFYAIAAIATVTALPRVTAHHLTLQRHIWGSVWFTRLFDEPANFCRSFGLVANKKAYTTHPRASIVIGVSLARSSSAKIVLNGN